MRVLRPNALQRPLFNHSVRKDYHSSPQDPTPRGQTPESYLESTDQKKRLVLCPATLFPTRYHCHPLRRVAMECSSRTRYKERVTDGRDMVAEPPERPATQTTPTSPKSHMAHGPRLKHPRRKYRQDVLCGDLLISIRGMIPQSFHKPCFIRARRVLTNTASLAQYRVRPSMPKDSWMAKGSVKPASRHYGVHTDERLPLDGDSISMGGGWLPARPPCWDDQQLGASTAPCMI